MCDGVRACWTRIKADFRQLGSGHALARLGPRGGLRSSAATRQSNGKRTDVHCRVLRSRGVKMRSFRHPSLSRFGPIPGSITQPADPLAMTPSEFARVASMPEGQGRSSGDLWTPHVRLRSSTAQSNIAVRTSARCVCAVSYGGAQWLRNRRRVRSARTPKPHRWHSPRPEFPERPGHADRVRAWGPSGAVPRTRPGPPPRMSAAPIRHQC